LHTAACIRIISLALFQQFK